MIAREVATRASLLLCVIMAAGADDVQCTVKPYSDAVVVGTPIELILHLTSAVAGGTRVTLGSGGLENVSILVARAGAKPIEASYIRSEGWGVHDAPSFVVDGKADYGFFLEEFIALSEPGRYELTVRVEDVIPLKATTSILVISDGLSELTEIAKVALRPAQDSQARKDAGRALSYYARPEAAPHLIELMSQYNVHGTRVMTIAMDSMLRANDPYAIHWLWDEAAKGKVPALVQYKDFIRDYVLRDAGKRPTKVKSDIVK